MGRLSTFLCLALLVVAASAQGRKSKKPSKQANKDDGRIVGGRDTHITETPYLCSIQDLKSGHFCGSSLIDEKYVLTAAHCTDGINARDLQVCCGVTELAKPDWNAQCSKVKRIVQHPNYNKRTTDNDAAVMELTDAMKAGTDHIQVVRLDPVDPKAGQEILAAGWGTMEQNARHGARSLQSVKVPVIDRPECQKMYRRMGAEITNNMMCAGLKEGGKDSCQGDSGGPVTIGEKQVGIVSWGIGCAKAGAPGVYTRMNQFIPWVEETIRSSSSSNGETSKPRPSNGPTGRPVASNGPTGQTFQIPQGFNGQNLPPFLLNFMRN